MLTLAFVALVVYAGYNGWMFGVHLFEALVGILMLPYGIYLDVQWRRRRRLDHPDNNFYNLPRLNAIGFDEYGAPILPDEEPVPRPHGRPPSTWRPGRRGRAAGR